MSSLSAILLGQGNKLYFCLKKRLPQISIDEPANIIIERLGLLSDGKITNRQFYSIKVYNDHVWFYNPGGLPEGITIEELKKPHQSFLRNILIAKVFYLAGFIEQYGSGTVRMIEWMKDAGLPEQVKRKVKK